PSSHTVWEYLREKGIERRKINGCDTVLVSLQALPRTRVLTTLSLFSETVVDGIYAGKGSAFSDKEIPVYIHAVSPKSYADFASKMSGHLEVLEGKGL
ncbi:unnamed protein product, partial [marine sediment metagenome]